jgi:forespore regulator of the sigma-K checkpoint
MRRRWRFTWTWCAVLVAMLLAAAFLNNGKDGGKSRLAFDTVDPAMEVSAQPYELVLARTYLCGVKDEEHKPVSRDKLAQMMTEYNGWEIISADETKLILLKRENDIAPSCKANGYFGLSGEGVLTLFNGLPAEQNVVQTFYQINTAKMEASLPKEEVESLKKGIRVRDLAEYHSVLSTYEEFQEDTRNE